jgi:hypothetical protein
VPQRPRQVGNPGYPWHVVVRVLVYAVLSGIFTNKGLVTHLKNDPTVREILGLKTVPHRKTIARWKKNKWSLLRIVIRNLGNMIQEFVPNKLVIFDSAPIPDKNDPEGSSNQNSRGWFFGFKIHVVVNQFGMPLRAMFSEGRRHDSPFLKVLIKGLKRVWFGLADPGYCSKANRKRINAKGGIALIDRNFRRSPKPKGYRRPWLLKVFRFIVEQTFSNLKESVLEKQWYRVKGFERKASFVYTGIIAMQVMAIDNLLKERGCEWMRISEYR